MSRTYKDYKIYCCFTLNRLVSELGIDLYQSGLESKIDSILAANPRGLSKEEIKHVIEKLIEDGLVTLERLDGRYEVRITKAGVLYIRKYNEFFLSIYSEEIRDHYKYRGMPHWVARNEKGKD
jgi:predicted transcriptional regulator